MNWKTILVCALTAILAVTAQTLGQGVVRGLQFSQDNSSGIGVDGAYNLYFTKSQHILTFGAPSPVLSGCGTAPSIVGNDLSFKVTTGTGTTTCIVTFVTPYLTAPQCVVTPYNSATPPTYATSAAAVFLNTVTASTIYVGICVGVS